MKNIIAVVNIFGYNLSMAEYGVSKLRNEILDRLAAAYSEGKLSAADYESRVDAAGEAETIKELTELVKDLGPITKRPPPGVPEVTQTGSDTIIFKLMGDRDVLPRDFEDNTAVVINILGDVRIDLRSIRDKRTIIINCYSLLGDTNVILPPGYDFKKSHISLLGDFRFRKREYSGNASGENGTVILKGFKLLGDVTVTPGEYYLE